MVSWMFCKCGHVIDEYEKECYWCGTYVDSLEKKEESVVEKQLMLFDEHNN